MKLLPIVERELRAGARRWGTYWLRTWVGLAVGIVGAAIVVSNPDEAPHNLAFILFHTIGFGGLIYCLLIGSRTTADCLSEEKREGTLGLLFLTDLKGYDVVLGKLVANSLNAFYGLLTVIPLACVALLMGGIKPEQILWVALVLVNTLFLSVAAGVLASACCRSSWRATGLAGGIMILLTLGLPALEVAPRMFGHGAGGAPDYTCFLASPLFSYVAPHDLLDWRHDLSLYFQSLAVIHGLAWFMVILACIIAPRSWQDRPAGVARLRWQERFRQWGHGDPEQRRAFRTRLLNDNAFFWLAARDRLRPAMVWGVLGAVFCFWVWGWSYLHEEWLSPAVFLLFALGINSVLKNWFAVEATRRMSEERQAGSLELLLVTPLEIGDIVRGQWLALRRQFFWPVLVVLGCELVMLQFTLRQSFDPADRTVWISLWLAGMACLVLDLVALFWVGLWMGLAAKHPKRAYSDTVGRILAVPWVIFLAFMFVTFFLSVRGQMEASPMGLLGFWFVVSVMVDVAYAWWASSRIYTQMREAATLRYQRRTSWWRDWFRGAA